MAKFIKGDIVVIPFPFSDLTGTKRRPAFVLADLPGNDIILCQITSRFKKDKFVVELGSNDFVSGNLPVQSYIRPNRLFTSDKKIIIRKAGKVNNTISTEVLQKIISILSD